MSICEVKSFYKCRIPRPTRPCGNPVKVKSVVRPQKKCGIPRPIRPWGRPVSIGRKVSVREEEGPLPEVSDLDTSGEDVGCANVILEILNWIVWLVTGVMSILDPFNVPRAIFEDEGFERIN